jgi:hypothetical protein
MQTIYDNLGGKDPIRLRKAPFRGFIENLSYKIQDADPDCLLRGVFGLS